MKRFTDKVVIITGGAGGIGLAAAARFGQEGATVILWDVPQSKGDQAAAGLAARGWQAHFFAVDITHPEAVEEAARVVNDRFGRIDVLINNAGITRDATLRKMTLPEWQQVIDVNLTGVFNCTKAVAAYMIEKNGGRIINTSSVVGLQGNFGQTNYAATKAGLIGMTKTLARELGRYNITVNAVAPGFIATEMVATIPEKVIAMVQERTALKRLGRPEDVAAAYCFLASEDAAFISGAVLSVDGAVSL
jgi:3-oxoacyl-[acyl-carrier protein] reductase